MKFSGKIVALLIVISLIIGAGGSFAAVRLYDKDKQVKQSVNEGASGNREAQKIISIHDLIEKNYYKKVDGDKLYDGAIKGMIEALHDPFSSYMDPENAKEFTQSLSSSFKGIGAEVQSLNGKISIVSTIKGSPAEKAGLKSNDQIIAIDGKTTQGLSINQAVSKIKGKKGTVVHLQVKRPGISHTLSFNIKRDEIPLKTVYSKMMKQDRKHIGYINITSFNERTDKEFNDALRKLEDRGMDGLIIDVRNNPGGYLEAVEHIASQFITKDKPIVQIENRYGKRQSYTSSLERKKPYPITALIDGGTASASEILSGALKEAGGYPIIGTKSFGKGTVQQGIQMEDSSELKLTTFKWLTPDGHWIHKKGIKPTIEVKQPDYFYVSPLSLDKGKVLGYDHTSSKIKDAQLMLKGSGFDPGREDGYFDKQTDLAVRAFQKKNHLPVTGSIDKKTAGFLQMGTLKAIENPDNDLQLKEALHVIAEKVNHKKKSVAK
ncbi:S41 family peptidase [Scopulibacillus cellulosilyticus]|uniref:S41 family peptidase n=1 Tax=Scopulibacillus cellulosilyticus TaxID=2665665 RepID=A0ABW2PWR2_9BACL